MATVETVQRALTRVREALVADGYDLEVQGIEAGRVRLAISAGPQACADCLVPKDLMQQMIAQALRDCSPVVGIELRYPGES